MRLKSVPAEKRRFTVVFFFACFLLGALMGILQGKAVIGVVTGLAIASTGTYIGVRLSYPPEVAAGESAQLRSAPRRRDLRDRARWALGVGVVLNSVFLLSAVVIGDLIAAAVAVSLLAAMLASRHRLRDSSST